MTAYTAYDMLRYNRKRKAEFVEAQQRMSADSLEAARLAYMRGDASDEQISLVEEANARAGGAGGDFKLPSILSSPKPLRRDEEVAGQSQQASGAGDAAAGETKSSGLFGWFSSKKSTQDATGSGEVPRTLEDKQDMLRKAREAFEKEKETQRSGGPLDRLGIEESTAQQAQTKESEQPKKKGWW